MVFRDAWANGLRHCFQQVICGCCSLSFSAYSCSGRWRWADTEHCLALHARTHRKWMKNDKSWLYTYTLHNVSEANIETRYYNFYKLNFHSQFPPACSELATHTHTPLQSSSNSIWIFIYFVWTSHGCFISDQKIFHQNLGRSVASMWQQNWPIDHSITTAVAEIALLHSAQTNLSTRLWMENSGQHEILVFFAMAAAISLA